MNIPFYFVIHPLFRQVSDLRKFMYVLCTHVNISVYTRMSIFTLSFIMDNTSFMYTKNVRGRPNISVPYDPTGKQMTYPTMNTLTLLSYPLFWSRYDVLIPQLRQPQIILHLRTVSCLQIISKRCQNDTSYIT